MQDQVNSIVRISSNISEGCKHCATKIGGDDYADSVNHYIQEHGYRLLHIGTETVMGPECEAWHTTVAVLGK